MSIIFFFFGGGGGGGGPNGSFHVSVAFSMERGGRVEGRSGH